MTQATATDATLDPPPVVRVRPGFGTLLAWVGVALATVYLVFFGGASNFLASPQARILTQLVIVASFTVWLAVAWRRGEQARSFDTPLLRPGLLYAGVVLASALVSVRRASSLEAAALLLLALPGYLVVRTVLRHRHLRPRLDWLLIVATLAFLVAYLWQVLDQWLAWWRAAGISLPPLRPGNLGLTVGTSNAVAVYAELLTPIAAWSAWRRWSSRPIALLLAGLGATTVIITASRGAWVGTGLAAAAVVAWLVIRRRGAGPGAVTDPGPGPVGGGRRLRVSPPRTARSALRWALALAGLAIAAAILPVLVSRMLAGDSGRLELWAAGLQIWSEHPFLGGGPGSWPGLRPLTEITEPTFAVLYTPHSSLVQVLVETGAAGLVADLVLVGAIARLAWRSIRSARNGEQQVERVLVAASLLAVLIHSLVDPMFHIPAVVVLILLLVARLEVGDVSRVAGAEGPTAVSEDRLVSGPRLGRRTWPLLAGLPVMLGVILLIPIDLAMVSAQEGMDALDAGRTATAVAAFDRAVGLHDLAPYRVGQGIARAAVGDTSGALEALRFAADEEPFTFVAAQTAWLQAGQDPPAAAVTARQGLALGTYDPAANLNLAIVLDRAGFTGEARELLSLVFGQVPVLVYSAPPAGFPVDRLWNPARLAALDGLRKSAPATAALLDIRAHEDVQAAAGLAALPDSAERRLLLQVQAAERSGMSADMVQARADLRADLDNPSAMAAFLRLAQLARSQRDVDLVETLSYVQWADLPASDLEVRFDGGPGDAAVMSLPRWPNASDSRLGPRRPFLLGMATIEATRR